MDELRMGVRGIIRDSYKEPRDRRQRVANWFRRRLGLKEQFAITVIGKVEVTSVDHIQP